MNARSMGLTIAVCFTIAANARPQTADATPSACTQLDDGFKSALAAAIGETSFDAVWEIRGPRDAGWRLSNRDAGLRCTFTRSGATVAPIQGNDATWRWQLRVRGFGRGDAIAPLADVEPEESGCYVEYDRGALREWFLNGEHGLAHGITVLQAPPRDVSDAPLSIEVETGVDLALLPGGDARSLAFVDSCGERALTYAGLAAWDATGRPIAAQFAERREGFSILVDDADASYPLAIDPVIGVQQAKLVASNGAANRYFGVDVDIEGDRAVVVTGDPGHFTNSGNGRVYVFERVGGAWLEDATIAFPAPNVVKSVSLQGDSILVGDLYDPAQWNGEAYVWTKRAGHWQFEQVFHPHYGYWSYETMGWDVELHGDLAFIGNPDHTHGGGGWYRGCVYVYQRDPSNQDEFAEIYHLLAQTGYMGNSLAADGDTLVATANRKAVVFRGGPPAWTVEAELLPLPASINFQLSCALQGDTLFIGNQVDDDVAVDAGAVSVFVRNGTTWTEQQKLYASDFAAGDRFGASVCFAGDVVAIGASADDGAGVDAGAIYLFARNEGWVEQQKLAATDTAAGDRFGISVAADGGRLIVGGAYDDDSGSNSGSAYLFDVTATPAVVYCTAKVNSLGCVPHIGFSGTPSVSSAAPFTIRASNVLNGRAGLVYYGVNGRAAVPFQGGTRCVAAPFRRTAIQTSGGNPPPDDCSGVFALDFNGWIQSGADPDLVAGAVVDCQCWSRDPSSPGGTSLTDAVELTILP